MGLIELCLLFVRISTSSSHIPEFISLISLCLGFQLAAACLVSTLGGKLLSQETFHNLCGPQYECHMHKCLVTGQVPLSMEFSRQEYWSGFPAMS